MTVYECDLAVLEQRRRELISAAARARLGSTDQTPIRGCVARVLRATADAIEPRPKTGQRSYQL